MESSFNCGTHPVRCQPADPVSSSFSAAISPLRRAKLKHEISAAPICAEKIQIPNLPFRPHLSHVAVNPESPLDKLWQEYAAAFENYDDLTLSRWMAQTLGQIEGKCWRLSHPLIGALRLAAQVARDRGVAVQRLATIPAAY